MYLAPDVMTERVLSSAEAAKRLGVTAKALRLYEEHGLVKPIRNASGWRTYGPAQMARLHQVLTLKTLGFSLADIANLLSGKTDKLDAVLALQERALTQENDRISHALVLMRAARQKLAQGLLLSISDLIKLTQETTALTPLWEKYFTKTELDEIARRNDLNEEEFISTWRGLLEEIKLLAEKGDPHSPEALDLGRRWLAHSERYIGGDEVFGNKLRAFSEEAMADPQAMASLPFTREIYNFLSRIVERLNAEQ